MISPSSHLRPLTCWCCHGRQRIRGVTPSLQMAGRCGRGPVAAKKVSGCDSVVTLRSPLFNSPLPCLRRHALLFAERLRSSLPRAAVAVYRDSAALMQLDNRGLGSDLATFPRPPPPPPRGFC